MVEDSITHNPTSLPNAGDASAPPASPVPDIVTSHYSFKDELPDDTDCTPPSRPTALLLYPFADGDGSPTKPLPARFDRSGGFTRGFARAAAFLAESESVCIDSGAVCTNRNWWIVNL